MAPAGRVGHFWLASGFMHVVVIIIIIIIIIIIKHSSIVVQSQQVSERFTVRKKIKTQPKTEHHYSQSMSHRMSYTKGLLWQQKIWTRVLLLLWAEEGVLTDPKSTPELSQPLRWGSKVQDASMHGISRRLWTHPVHWERVTWHTNANCSLILNCRRYVTGTGCFMRIKADVFTACTEKVP